MTTNRPTYVYVAIKTLEDLGTLSAALEYCLRVADQGGEDSTTYRLAAESLFDVLNRKE